MRKNQLFMVVVVLSVAAFFASGAYAEEKWHKGPVVWAGTGEESLWIHMKDIDTGKDYACKAAGNYAKEMFDIALRAMTHRMNIRARFDDSKTYPLITNIRLVSD